MIGPGLVVRRAWRHRQRQAAALRAEAQRGAIVVMSTHDPAAAEEADAELALDEGRMRWARGDGGRGVRHTG